MPPHAGMTVEEGQIEAPRSRRAPTTKAAPARASAATGCSKATTATHTRTRQSVALEDIQNVTIRGNEMVGKATKAFALGKGSTGIIVQDNEIGPNYGREVGFDDPSAQQGYQGPPAG